MRTEVRYEDYARKFLEQLPRGAFLSVRGPRDNVMTIGWGTIGYMWKKPVLMVMVRRSRYNGAVSLSAADSVAARVALEGLEGVDSVEFEAASRRLVVLSRDGQSLFEPVSRRLAERDVAYREMQLERGRLDEVFRRITLGGEARGTRTRHDLGSGSGVSA